MRSLLSLPATAALLLALLAATTASASNLEGRWEGVIEVPGAPQPLVIDLAPQGNGHWVGSVILPGRGVKGAALGELVVGEDGLRCTLAGALAFPAESPPALAARLDTSGRLSGELQFAGLSAPLLLRRSGPAQVDLPPPSQPVDAALEGTWAGRFELLGSPRDVSLSLQARVATMRIVGRRTTDVPFALVRQRGAFLSLSGNPYAIVFEGNWAGDRIAGTFMQGPIELPLEMQRVAGED